jgi:zinc transport system ATP-binding protein
VSGPQSPVEPGNEPAPAQSPSPDETLLEARALELGYAGRRVLAGVDLVVRPGEAWFLLGANGSGKTTFLRAVLGLLEPTRGRLRLHPVLAARARLGFVPQGTSLSPSLPTTVREFVSLGLVGTRTPRTRRGQEIHRALEQVGLAALARSDFWSLSGGQRQRALLARALVRRPSWMLLDEPTEGLDVRTEEALLRTLGQLNRRDGLTLLFVTHRLAIAARHATHVALFHGGAVTAGPRAALVGSEAARSVFGAELEALR